MAWNSVYDGERADETLEGPRFRPPSGSASTESNVAQGVYSMFVSDEIAVEALTLEVRADGRFHVRRASVVEDALLLYRQTGRSVTGSSIVAVSD